MASFNRSLFNSNFGPDRMNSKPWIPRAPFPYTEQSKAARNEYRHLQRDFPRSNLQQNQRYPGSNIPQMPRYPGPNGPQPQMFSGINGPQPQRYPGSNSLPTQRFPGPNGPQPQRFPGLNGSQCQRFFAPNVPPTQRFLGPNGPQAQRFSGQSMALPQRYPGPGSSQIQRFPGSSLPQMQRYPDMPQSRGSLPSPTPPMLNRSSFEGPKNRNMFYQSDDFNDSRSIVPPPFPGTDFFERDPSSFKMRQRGNDRAGGFSASWSEQQSVLKQFSRTKRVNRTIPSGGLVVPNKSKRKKKKYSFKRKAMKQPMKPWMTEEIYEEVMKKNELYAKAKNENTEDLWLEFRIMRNRLSGKIKDAKVKAGILVKKSKDVDPTPRPHYCDNCDRAYAEKDELLQHFKDHVKCNLDGCEFEAHPKIILLHKGMQHVTGAFKKIQSANTPEEIEKWINERKNRYPTMEVIKKKKEEEAEKIARGEVIETKEFGKFRNRRLHSSCSEQRNNRSDNGLRRKKEWRRGQDRITRRPRTKFAKNVPLSNESMSDDDTHILLPRFKGMTNHDIDSNASVDFQISQKSLHSIPDSNNIVTSTELSSKLPTLVSENFTSDFDQREPVISSSNLVTSTVLADKQCRTTVDNDAPLEIPIVKAGINVESEFDNSRKTEDLLTNNTCSDDEAPMEIPTLKSTNENDDVSSNSLEQKDLPPKNKMNRKRKFKEDNDEAHGQTNCASSYSNTRPYKFPRKRNLLEKLLAKEISHERNVIFQCVRYIVKNNFFGIHSN